MHVTWPRGISLLEKVTNVNFIYLVLHVLAAQVIDYRSRVRALYLSPLLHYDVN